MQDTTTIMLYLMEPQYFETAKAEHEKFKYGFLTSELLEKITYDGVEYALYKINTNSMNVMAYASAASSMDGNVVKNKFTGAWAYLPESLKQLFERHTKSAGGSETK